MARKLKKLFKSKAFPALILLCCVLGMAAFLGSTLASSIQEGFIPSTFQPVQTTRVAFDVYDENDVTCQNPLGTIVVGEGASKYHDPDGHYPDVGTFRSNAPYPSDAAGNAMGAVELVTEKRVFGDRVVFKHQAKMTYDFGARTYTVLPPLRTDAERMITPVVGQAITYLGRTGTVRSTTAPDNTGWWDQPNEIFFVPRGTMISAFSIGTTPWRLEEQVGSARITQSLEPIDYDGEYLGSPAAGLTFNDAINRLKTNYGNKGVIVRPHVTLTGVNNFESYSWEQAATLSNGTTVTMSLVTTSAMVGFEDAYVAKQAWAGLVPKAYDEQFTRAGGNYIDPADAAEHSPASTTPPATLNEMQASLSYNGELSLPTGNVITRQIQPLEAWTSIDNSTPSIIWNEILEGRNSLPEQIDVYADFALRPQTTVRIAAMKAVGTIRASAMGSLYYHYEKTYQVPYAICIDNVASMFSMTVLVDLFTSNEVQMVTSSGLPIDVSTLRDFDLGSIINNPRADDMKFSTESVTWWDSIAGLFSGLFGGIAQFFTYALTAIGLVALLVLFSKLGIAKGLKKLFKHR